MDAAEELTEYSLRDLLAPPLPPPEPGDFDAFWRETFDELGTGPVEWSVARELPPTPTHRIEEIRFASSTGERVVAWLVVPADAERTARGLVVGHGYGGRLEPDLDRVPAGTAAIFPVAPGLPANAPGRFPATAERHVLAGIDSRRTYSHRYAVADLWRAATVLLDAAPVAAASLDYLGGSFGGGIGAMALPWDARFRRASLDVPSFGHHPLRLTRRSTGSGEAVRRHVSAHPEAQDVLRYFDAAVSARRIRIPVHVSAAVLDPAVDPRGQFAVYHALGGARRLTVRAVGHLAHPAEAASDALAAQDAADFLALPDDRVEASRADAQDRVMSPVVGVPAGP